MSRRRQTSETPVARRTVELKETNEKKNHGVQQDKGKVEGR
jgi:hypothetical protein